MHELGITQEILEIVTQRAQERKVKRVVLEIGRLSCVLPDAVRFCFDLCTEGTIAEGAELEILQPAGRGRCRLCGTEFRARGGSCPLRVRQQRYRLVVWRRIKN